jgi:hypothetical protein
MQLADILRALHKLIKPENETVEDIHYNEGVIAAITKVQELAALEKPKGERTNS